MTHALNFIGEMDSSNMEFCSTVDAIQLTVVNHDALDPQGYPESQTFSATPSDWRQILSLMNEYLDFHFKQQIGTHEK